MRALHVAVVMTLAATGGTRVLAQAPGLRSVRDGVYTTAQADQGQAVYDDKCAVCHGTMATISPDMAPLLNDHTFRARWTSRSLAELFELIRETMPQDAPGTLSPERTADLVAYILNGNRLPPGEVTLTDDAALLVRPLFEP